MEQTGPLFQKTWDRVLGALSRMLQMQSLSPKDFLAVSNSVQVYFTSTEYEDSRLLYRQQQQPANNNGATNAQYQVDENRVDGNIPGGTMYFTLKRYIIAHVEQIAQNKANLEGEQLLRYYVEQWSRYRSQATAINGFLNALNAHWVNRMLADNVAGLRRVFHLAIHVWEMIFFRQSNQMLTRVCLGLIQNERRGERIDTSLIKKVVQSYVTIGSMQAENRGRCTEENRLSVYKSCFETEFLTETELFYQLEKGNYPVNHSTLDYVRKVTQRSQQEKQRLQSYLHETTATQLRTIVREVLIETKIDVMLVEAERLIENGNTEDLRMLHDLVREIPNASAPTQRFFLSHVSDAGTAAIAANSEAAINDPKVYVETILDIHTKFFKLIQDAFGGEQGFTAALDKACGKFINNNAVTQAAGNTTKSPELLARYCDALLRKGGKAVEETDLEEKFNQIMVVFNYVEDKDVFQKFYGKMLAKRLVAQLSASDDYEESMISKLKQACGFEYTSKLQRMFQDIGVSKNLIEQYRTYCQAQPFHSNFEFSIMILSSNSWSLSSCPEISLSMEMQATFDSITRFYTQKFNGRKLTWLHQHSKGELQTLYTKPKYILSASVYQMVVLDLFNEHSILTVEQIGDRTRLKIETLRQTVASLIRTQLLLSPDIKPDKLASLKDEEIQFELAVTFNPTFKSKKMKININQPIKAVERQETDSVNQSIEEDRKMVIQAAIVRIMKMRKKLSHTPLIDEVIQQLSSRFQPKIPLIKKCIDLLIEKEYLERDTKHREIYNYLA